MRLYMVILGCKPTGRFTEQHDVFFGIGNSLGELVPQMKAFWPGVKLHIDSWREVTVAENYHIKVVPKETAVAHDAQLFFFNLGGYKENDLEEYHYKVLTVANDLATATKNAKATSFYKHVGFKGANSHIDDKYGVDVDDVYKVSDILGTDFKEQYTLQLTASDTDLKEDELHIGYLVLDRLLK